MKKITFIAALIIAATIATAPATVRAQTNAKTHDLIISVGGGMSNLNAKSDIADKSPASFGAVFGLGYIYYFSEQFGINTGLEISTFKGKSKFSAFSENYPAHDGEENFDFRYTLSNFSETQNAVFINIPLMLRFQQGKFYAAAGGKIGLPLSATYKNKAGSLQTSGYYSEYDLRLPVPAFAGFGEYRNLTGSGKMSFSTAFFLSAEAGVKWEFTGKTLLYTGVYFDYGLNNIHKKESTHLIAYNGSNDYRPNGSAASSSAGKSFIDKISPLSFGVKISLSFGSARWWFTGRNGEKSRATD